MSMLVLWVYLIPLIGPVELGIWFVLVGIALAVSLTWGGRAGRRRQR